MSTYAIGDVQGCFEELQLLLKKIQFKPQQDQLWFVGDLVNRGPDSLAVLRYLIDIQDSIKVVLGNHDLHLLALAAGIEAIKRQDTLEQVLAANDVNELLNWLRAQPLIHYDSHFDIVMTHAGIYPYWSLAQTQVYAAEVTQQLQQPDYVQFLAAMYGNEPIIWNEKLTGNDRWRFIINALTRMRFCSLRGELDLKTKEGLAQQPKGYLPWFKIPQRTANQHTIVFGHWAALNGVTHESKVLALDTGCAWGNELTALRLEDRKRFSVPSLL